MAVTGNTQLSATKNDVIAAMVQRELKFSAKLLNTVTDVSMFAAKGMKSVSFPTAGSFTVENRATATQGTIQDLTFAKEQLDLDYRAYVAWLVDSVDEYQASVDVQSEYVKRASTAHARNIDEIILTKLDAVKGHVETAGIDRAKILNCRQFIIQNFGDLSSLVMVVKPSDENLLLNIADFVRADAYGSSNIPSGVIGRLFGANVMIHAGATKSFMYTKEALAWAFQKAPQYDEQKDIRYGTGSMLAAVDQLYGSKALQLGKGKELDNTTAIGAGESPFVAVIG